jgi:hypothetical protein
MHHVHRANTSPKHLFEQVKTGVLLLPSRADASRGPRPGGQELVAIVQHVQHFRVMHERLFDLVAGAIVNLPRAPECCIPRPFPPVPIVLAYVVAHYFSFLVLEGQLGLVRLSDPWGQVGTCSARPTGP